MQSKDDQYSPEETARRFERALKKSFIMTPLHQGVPKEKKKAKRRAKPSNKGSERV